MAVGGSPYCLVLVLLCGFYLNFNKQMLFTIHFSSVANRFHPRMLLYFAKQSNMWECNLKKPQECKFLNLGGNAMLMLMVVIWGASGSEVNRSHVWLVMLSGVGGESWKTQREEPVWGEKQKREPSLLLPTKAPVKSTFDFGFLGVEEEVLGNEVAIDAEGSLGQG